MKDFAFRAVVVTLSIVIVAMCAVLLFGLFDPRVDNKAIFEIIGCGFDMTLGCFVTLAGLLIKDRSE